MNKLYAFLFFILCNVNAIAQNDEFLVFEEHTGIAETPVTGSIKLRSNHILLSRQNSGKNEEFNIYNLYFSKNRFKPAGLDKASFRLAYNDCTKLANDVLITLTPLTTSNNEKLTKLDNAAVKTLNVLTPRQILQRATIELYNCFVQDELSNDSHPAGTIKTKKYKLLIKKGNDYFKTNAEVLTEFYLIDQMGYSFTSQYHFGELNAASDHLTSYYNAKDMVNLRSRYGIIDKDGIALRNKILPMRIDSILTLYPVIRYGTYPPDGIGYFDFFTGIGVINGSFDHFFNDASKANGDLDNFDVGKMRLIPKEINGMPIKEFAKQHAKQIEASEY